MEKTAFLNIIKEKLSIVSERFINWIKNNKKLSVIIGVIIIIIIICIIILTTIRGSKQEQKVFSERLELSQELLIPDGPALPRDYTISRETKKNWSDEESKEWFSTPSEKDVDGLSKANDNIIDEIIGAAP